MMGRAFTLLETLAAVVLLSMATVLGAGLLLGAGERAAVDRALVLVETTDADARTLAMTQGNATLELAEDGRALWILVGREVVLARDIPGGVDMHLLAHHGRPLAEVRFDSRGRSENYQLVFLTGEERRILRISGLTGSIVEVEP